MTVAECLVVKTIIGVQNQTFSIHCTSNSMVILSGALPPDFSPDYRPGDE